MLQTYSTEEYRLRKVLVSFGPNSKVLLRSFKLISGDCCMECGLLSFKFKHKSSDHYISESWATNDLMHLSMSSPTTSHVGHIGGNVVNPHPLGGFRTKNPRLIDK